jgi:hypothetical protein
MYRTARQRLADSASSQYRMMLNPQKRLVIETGTDRRRENLPTSDEVAVILSNEFKGGSCRDIIDLLLWLRFDIQ